MENLFGFFSDDEDVNEGFVVTHKIDVPKAVFVLLAVVALTNFIKLFRKVKN